VRLAFLLVILAQTGLVAQAPSAPATLTSAADLTASLEKAVIRADGSRVATFLDKPGQRANLVRRAGGAANNAIVHGKGTEVHYVVDGRATLVTGGVLVSPARSEARAEDSVGPSIKDGLSRRVGTGDVIVIPVGTAHQYIDIEGAITYLEVRFDTQ
jgi:mannose-6-phosphate isomerase-like protein (cupin superfamily)